MIPLVNLLTSKFSDKDYIPEIDMTASEARQSGLLDFNKAHDNKFIRNVLNFAHVSNELEQVRSSGHLSEENDYVGIWEDAFIFKGFENGEHKFLTSAISNIMGRHGFVVLTTAHKSAYRRPDIGNNEVIISLKWRGRECIPDRDVGGDPVIVGISDPRLYLPRIVQDLFDLEFGYDTELIGKETAEKQFNFFE